MITGDEFAFDLCMEWPEEPGNYLVYFIDPQTIYQGNTVKYLCLMTWTGSEWKNVPEYFDYESLINEKKLEYYGFGY